MGTVEHMHEEFMSLAISEAKKGCISGDGGPFGAVVVKNGKVLAVAHNTVLADNDPVQHAEIRAISMASRAEGTYDLSGCDIYSTTEPCPMCFSAIHWARISRIIYGTSIDDVKELGFNELSIKTEIMKNTGGSPVKICHGFMREECKEVLEIWKTLPNAQVY